jgi:hypothetical protein
MGIAYATHNYRQFLHIHIAFKKKSDLIREDKSGACSIHSFNNLVELKSVEGDTTRDV